MAGIGLILGLVGSISSKVFGIVEKMEERKLRQLELEHEVNRWAHDKDCLLYTSPSPRDRQKSRMPSSA